MSDCSQIDGDCLAKSWQSIRCAGNMGLFPAALAGGESNVLWSVLGSHGHSIQHGDW